MSEGVCMFELRWNGFSVEPATGGDWLFEIHHSGRVVAKAVEARKCLSIFEQHVKGQQNPAGLNHFAAVCRRAWVHLVVQQRQPEFANT